MKKGFTLVEILAVLVVMGLITGVIYVAVDKKLNRATDTSIETSARNYIRAVEQQFVNVDMDTEDMPAGTYKVASLNVIDGKTYSSMNTITGIEENKPTDGYVTVNEDGKVEEASLLIRRYEILYSNNKYQITKKATS